VLKERPRRNGTREGAVAIRTFRDLIVWQRGMELARVIYRETEKMPRAEMFGLTSQMRRAAASVPMNIAEGFGKHTRPEFVRGLRIAMGSLNELSTAYELATSMELIRPKDAVLELQAEVDRLLSALVRKLESKRATDRP
jgi:four helix bundle protein